MISLQQGNCRKTKESGGNKNGIIKSFWMEQQSRR